MKRIIVCAVCLLAQPLSAAPGAPADLNFYALYPDQAQVSLSGPAGAFCASAFNADHFFPFPVIMCAGSSADGKRFGVTPPRIL